MNIFQFYIMVFKGGEVRILLTNTMNSFIIDPAINLANTGDPKSFNGNIPFGCLELSQIIFQSCH